MLKEEIISQLKESGKSENPDYNCYTPLIHEYPLFSVARAMQLIASAKTNKEDFHKLLRKHAAHIHNPKYLHQLLKNTEKNLPDSDDLDEGLLSFNYKGEGEVEEVKVEGEVKVEDKVKVEGEEFSEENEGERYETKMRGSKPERKFELIDRFIETNPGSIRSDESSAVSYNLPEQSVMEDDSLITDTLAKIYIKQGLYSKAIYAYEKLILKYPEKSIYFAAQIEDIKKLINK